MYGQNFTLTESTPFKGATDGSAHLIDIDGDGDLDFFNTGADQGGDGFHGTAELFTNNGSGSFTLVAGTPFPGVESAGSEFADIEDDGDIDLILTGVSGTSPTTVRIANLYINDGTGTYTIDATASGLFKDVSDGDVIIEDLDGDGDLDVIISGYNTAAKARITEVYKNNGANPAVFTLFTASPAFDLADEGDVDVADVDGDGDLDLLTTGDTGPSELTSLYLNDGTGVFTKDATASALFTDLRDSDADFADVNGDQKPDLLINGRYGSGDRVANLYINTGGGAEHTVSFVLATETPFKGGNAGTVDFFDADNDGDMDVLISGYENNSPNRNTRLYGNDGNGNFTAQTSETFTGVNNADIAVGDVNGDSYKDIIITGYSSKRIAELYVNSGASLTVDATQKLQNALRVFPNPATDVLTIQSNRGMAAKRIQLCNMLGQVVANANANNKDIEIDVSSLHPGVYLLNIASGNESMVKKVIKE